MNLKQLEYFVAIAEEQQITAAARRLHISQPPLSYELATLERELGCTLVKRGPRRATLTSAGALLYERALSVLALVRATEREVSAFGKGLAGTLSIGMISSCGGMVPTDEMQAFRDDYPDVSFEVHEGNTFQVLEMLERGIIDVGVVRTPFKADGLAWRLADPEPLAVVMPAELALGDGSSVTVEELADQPLVLYRRFEPAVRQAFADRAVPLFVACLNDDARTTFSWARHGMGIGLLPLTALAGADATDLVVRTLDCEELDTRQAVVWNPRRHLSPLAARFVEHFPTTDANEAGASIDVEQVAPRA